MTFIIIETLVQEGVFVFSEVYKNKNYCTQENVQRDFDQLIEERTKEVENNPQITTCKPFWAMFTATDKEDCSKYHYTAHIHSIGL